jgi:predicted amidophosphoribosyltransferase
MDALQQLLSLLAPPSCAACGASCPAAAQLCGACEGSLDAMPRPAAVNLPGLDRVWAAAPHDGVARELVVALKFRSMLAVAVPIARRIAERAPPGILLGALVPVPPAPSRLWRRGFDPAEEIAKRLADRTGQPLCCCLSRADGPRQVGRSRTARLAEPPRVRAVERVPAAAVLVDDVQTTGATLSACARALRDGRAERISALTFARTM